MQLIKTLGVRLHHNEILEKMADNGIKSPTARRFLPKIS